MLVVLMCVVSIFVWAFEGPEPPWTVRCPVACSCGRTKVLEGQVWRIVTWPLVNEPSIWAVVSLALLWYFGSEIERLLGRNRFAIFLLLVTVIPGVVGTLIDLPQAGIRPIEMAVFLLFVVEYPFVRFFFGIPAWAIGAVILGIEILQLLERAQREGDRCSCSWSSPWRRSRRARWACCSTCRGFRRCRSAAAVRAGSGGRSRRAGRGSSGGGDVVAGPWTSATRSGPTGSAPLPQPPVSSADVAADQRELDALLDKISDAGMDGLSADEKRRLNELSKRMRGRR